MRPAPGKPYVVQVKSATSAYPEQVRPERPKWSGRGRPPAVRYRAQLSSLKQLALAAGKRAARDVTWREGSRGPIRSRFLALRIRPANRELRAAARESDTELPARWLLAEWPANAAPPTDYWLSSPPPDTDLGTIVRLAKLRWRIEHDYRELKDALGLDHFEGRSYRGWHHHVTCVSVAHAFLTLERLRPRTRRQPDPLRAAARAAAPDRLLARPLPNLPQTAAAQHTPPRPTLN